jgi:hypothetical protein
VFYLFTVQVIRNTDVSIFVHVIHLGEEEPGGQGWEEEEERRVGRQENKSGAALRRRGRSRWKKRGEEE